MPGLTRKQQAFVDALVADPTISGTEAAIRAGFSKETARSQASRMLTNVDIRAALDAGMAEAARSVGVRADVVLRELLRIATVDIAKAFDDEGNLLPIKDIPEDVRRAIAGVDAEELWEGKGQSRERTGTLRKVKFWDKPAALRDLGRHLGLWRDKLEHSGELRLTYEQLIEQSLAAPPQAPREDEDAEDEEGVE